MATAHDSELHHRWSIRIALSGYPAPSWYFVTIDMFRGQFLSLIENGPGDVTTSAI